MFLRYLGRYLSEYTASHASFVYVMAAVRSSQFTVRCPSVCCETEDITRGDVRLHEMKTNNGNKDIALLIL
jgi:hypothetical protein